MRSSRTEASNHAEKVSVSPKIMEQGPLSEAHDRLGGRQVGKTYLVKDLFAEQE